MVPAAMQVPAPAAVASASPPAPAAAHFAAPPAPSGVQTQHVVVIVGLLVALATAVILALGGLYYYCEVLDVPARPAGTVAPIGPVPAPMAPTPPSQQTLSR